MKTKRNLYDIRQEYLYKELSKNELNDDPFDFLKRWIDDAISFKVEEPTAMNLATVDSNGQPSGRIVLLKDITRNGICFFTNYESRKAFHLSGNARAAATFFWPAIERQIRIEGSVIICDSEISDQYFNSRPYESKIAAWASPQSKSILNRDVLVEKFESLKHQFKENDPIPRPQNWGGFQLQPHLFEFWQGRKSRLHDRFQYQLIKNAWVIERLAP
jgi:pyridoxamine 5'-phosphate oxidase